MALPGIMKRLFEKAGFGNYLNKDIIPNHNDIHSKSGRDPLKLDASQITSGVLNANLLPDSVKERLVEVSNQSDILNLTKDQVQNGDKVIIKSTGIWYIVIDDTKLNSPDGYIPLGSTGFISPDNGDYVKGAMVSRRLETPITVQSTGVNAIQENWDGSQNINLKITSIDKELINGYIYVYHPVNYIIEDCNILSSDMGKIFCATKQSNLTLPHPASEENTLVNGWNIFIKNLSNEICRVITLYDTITIDLKDSLEIPPLMSVQVFFDGTNFISINTTPLVTL